jgi:hypothetical protein
MASIERSFEDKPRAVLNRTMMEILTFSIGIDA